MDWYTRHKIDSLIVEAGFKENIQNFSRESFYTIVGGLATMALVVGAVATLEAGREYVGREIRGGKPPKQVYRELITLQKPQPSVEVTPQMRQQVQEAAREIEAVEQIDAAPDQQEYTKDDIMTARVIYSEASEYATDKERELVAGVMKNRIGHPGFGMGKLKSMKDAAFQPSAFSAIGDENNVNWADSARPEALRDEARDAWDKSLKLATGNVSTPKGKSGRPLVYYHDKSINKPSNWDNKYWTAVLELETEHFMFYSVIPTKGNK